MFPHVKIYSTPTCVYCKMTKKFLTGHNVPYEDLDVSQDEAALAEMVKKSHQLGVPVIEVGNQVFVGFDQEALTEVLHLK